MYVVTSEIRLAIVLIGELLLPGWAWLAISGLWRRWDGLQSWIVAIGASIACYPVLFYGLRFIAPWFTLGPYKMSAGLLLCLVVIVWRMRDEWRAQFAFEPLEWAALALLGAILLTRLWIIRDHPFPAWSDSLHHAILTRLTAVQGQLPTTMAPYFPIPLDQYHLGLYSLTASVMWLAQVPAHTALLWTAQVLNGLCGLGVYFVIDRRVGRRGALVGAAVVGLLMHQPAWYVNWGRFTQLAAQTLVLIAWDVTWEMAIDTSWRKEPKSYWAVGGAAVLSAGVFLLHFRVAVLYAVLFAVGFGVERWTFSTEQRRRALAGSAIIVALAVALAAPALWQAGRFYLASTAQAVAMSPEEREVTQEAYFSVPWDAVPALVARRWLLMLAGVSAVIGLWRRVPLVMIQVAWLALSVALGFAYLLGVPWLAFTNLGMVLVGLYLPLSVIIGGAAEALMRLPAFVWLRAPAMAVLGVWICLAGSHLRATGVEPSRYFVTPEDVTAMQWIRENTPEDALFAVNTHFWLPRAPHGTDAGYWIPYFTGRRTNTGVMLNNLGPAAYQNEVVATSRAVKRVAEDVAALDTLREAGITHIYLGAKGNFAGPGLDRAALIAAPGAHLVYESQNVAIFALGSADGAD